jgi:hypothetical protein
MRRRAPRSGKNAAGHRGYFPGPGRVASKRLMSWIVLLALIAQADPSEAGAPQVVVTVEQGAALPEGVDIEIRDALISRSAGLHAGFIRILLRQQVAEIRVDDTARSVPIEEWESGAAVRVVVLHAVDLASPPPAAVAAPAPPDEAPPTVVTAPAAPPPRTPMMLVASVGPRVLRGVQHVDVLAFGAELSVGVRRGSARVSAGLRWARGLGRGDGTPNDAAFDLYLGTLTAAWWFLGVEATVEPFIGPARLTTAGGQSLNGFVYGLGTGLRAVGQPRAGISWFGGVGVDYYASRLVNDIAGSVVYATPRVAPYVTLGASFGASP